MSIGKVWDEKFLREGYLYGEKPNAFLAQELENLSKKSLILFLGEGEGRNACYAALMGFDVTALDASEIGLKKTAELAEKMHVTVQTVLQDLEYFQATQQYDVLMASFLHLEEPLRTVAFRSVLGALRPGGLFIAEFFSLKQLPHSSGGPKKSDLLYTTVSLRDVFSVDSARIVLLEETVDHLDEGKGHQGEAYLIRMIIEKR